MSDQSEELPFMAPPPITEPSEINLEAGPANQIQCRICLKTDGRDFIAPCKCKGKSKYCTSGMFRSLASCKGAPTRFEAPQEN